MTPFRTWLAAAAMAALAWLGWAEGAAARPNIVLVIFDDLSPRLGAYGDPLARTPELDAFAETAIRFERAFTTAPVCAPSRAALLTGVHQQTLGASHMRTSAFGSTHAPDGFEIGYDATPPPEVRAIPELLRQLGYTAINGFGDWPFSDKRDYQFGAPFTMWDLDGPGAHWRGRADPDAPFFLMANMATTHEGFLWPTEPAGGSALARQVGAFNARVLADKSAVTDPAAVIPPLYLPDTPVVRADLARLYDNLHFSDRRFGALLAALRADGLEETTIVIVIADHGDGLPRAKRSLYDSGLRVPLLIRIPGAAGMVRRDLASGVDLAPTLLSLAGAQPPAWMQGRALLGAHAAPERPYVFAASDRNNTLEDRAKAVRDARFKLIRNYRPDLALLRPLAYRDQLPTMGEIWRLHARNALTPLQRSYLQTPRPREELYDTLEDPHETVNLANDPRHAGVRRRLSRALDAWLAQTPDMSVVSERDMVARMWPGFRQPHTAPPAFTVSAAPAGWRVALDSPTPGASIGYRLPTDPAGRWRLYVGPVTLADPTGLQAKAIRYGYAESRPVTWTEGTNP